MKEEMTVYKETLDAIEEVLEWAQGEDTQTAQMGINVIAGICTMADRFLELERRRKLNG